VLIGLTLAGSLGYVWIEGWSFADALFMTVTTLATVGYGEVHPLSPGGRAFTMGLIAAGVGVTIYLVTVIAQLVFEGQLRQWLLRSAMQRKIDSLSGHVVVCGFGRFGRVVAEELQRAGRAVVVVEREAALAAELAALDVPHVIGSACADDVLERAGLRRAQAIVAGTGSDAENIFITLTARETAPEIAILARGESEPAARRLRRAGADHVTALYRTAGLRAAATLLQPTVVDFLEIARPHQGEPIDLEEIRVGAGSVLAGQTLAAIESSEPGLRIVALKRAGETVRLVPEPASPVGAHDHLIVIGDREPLQRLAERARVPRAGAAGGHG
jgi:voltage-gated potassium channel